jgi:ubiquitin C-terminal hydrolase
MNSLLRVVGLRNPIGGNICFMNAVIQGLLGVPDLAAEAKGHTHEKTNPSGKTNIFLSIFNIVISKA